MKKAIIKSFFFALLILSTAARATAKDMPPIIVTHINKDFFKISNTHEFLSFIIVLKNTKWILDPGTSQTFSTREYDNEVVNIIYPELLYINQLKAIEQTAKRYGVYNDLADFFTTAIMIPSTEPLMVPNYVDEGGVKVQRGFREQTASEMFDQDMVGIAAGAIGKALLEISKEHQAQRIRTRIAVNKLVFEAANGNQNEYSAYFSPIKIRASKRGYSPRFSVSAFIGFEDKHSNNFWITKSYKGMFGFPLSPELAISKRLFCRLHGFYEANYRMIKLQKTNDKAIYSVGNDYVQNASADFHTLNTHEQITGKTLYHTVGVYLKTFYYTAFFIDVGAGYTLPNAATNLHFKGANYITNNTLLKTNWSTVAKMNQAKYGFIKIGVNLEDLQQRRAYREKTPYKGINFIGGVELRSFTSVTTDQYQLYYAENNMQNKIPIETEDQKLNPVFYLGINYAF